MRVPRRKSQEARECGKNGHKRADLGLVLYRTHGADISLQTNSPAPPEARIRQHQAVLRLGNCRFRTSDGIGPQGDDVRAGKPRVIACGVPP